MQLLNTRQLDGATIYLVADAEEVHVVVRHTGGERPWEGSATFTLANRQEAERRFLEVETDDDIEDLLREWGNTSGETVQSFLHAVASEGSA